MAKIVPFVAAAVTFVATGGNVALAQAAFAITSAVVAIATPKPKAAPAQEKQAATLTLTLGEQAREFVFGTVCTAGSLTNAWNYGGKYGTDFECLRIAVADHAIDSVVGYYVNDEYHAWAGEGGQAAFSNELDIEFINGSATPDGSVSRFSPPEDATDKLIGVTHFYVAYKDDPKVWTQGRPSFKFVLRGKRLYDPRKDSTVPGGSGPHRWEDPSTYEWTDNPEIARYNFNRGIFACDRVNLTDQLLIGRGLSSLEAPPEATFVAANICDERVALKAGGDEARYRASGVIRADESFDAVEADFAAAMAGSVVERDGGIQVDPGYAKAPALTFTDGDIVTGTQVSYSPFLPETERVNTVIPRYVEPAQLWADHAAPIRRNTFDVARDGGDRSLTLSLRFVTSGTQAQRCGEIARRLARLERRAGATLPPRMSGVEEGDWIAWTSERRHQGQTVAYQVTAYAVGQDWRNTPVLREIDASVYDWNPANDEYTPGTAPPASIPPPGALVLVGVTAVASSLSGVPAVEMHWTTPVDGAVTRIRMEVRQAGSAETTPTYTDNVAAGVLVSSNGVASETALEARLVPLGGPGRPVTPSAWLPVTSEALIAAGVPWTGVTDPANTRPDDNATVGATVGTDLKYVPPTGPAVVLGPADVITSQGTSSNTANVGARTAVQVVYTLDQLLVNVDGLATTYGSTASAAASAAAAQAAQNAAVVAQGIASAARTDAQTAFTAADGARVQALASATSAGGSSTAAAQARTDAQAASTAAANARTLAETAASGAAVSNTAAQGAQTAAGTARDAAIAQATAAQDSASTAAGSATTATQKASDALGSAQAASASATVATTAQGAASVSASQAASSKTDAAGSDSQAATSAGVSAAARDAAQTAATASSTSAQSAAASNTAAGQQASAATSQATAATTAAGNAQTSAGQASQSATNALGSSNTATSQAGLSATSANASGVSASAASGSASLASSKADAAGQSATTATSAASTATTQAGQAGVYRDQAATSATGAAGSASSASSNAGLSATARDAAQSASTASATSSQSAAASNTAAGQQASAAQGSATSAGTSAGSAQASAGQAATSASNAVGSSNSASLSAGVSATAQSAAERAAASAFPSTFENKGLAFTLSIYDPSGGPAIPDNRFYADPGLGNVFLSSAYYEIIATRGLQTLVAGRSYEVRATTHVYSAAPSTFAVGLFCFNGSGGYIGYMQTAATQVTTNGGGSPQLGANVYLTTEQIQASVSAAVSVRAIGIVNVVGGEAAVAGIQRLAFADVTERAAAQASATAAAGSYSAASAAQTAAGQYAASASSSFTQANTAFGGAQAAASQAAASASTAAGSSNSASISAGASAAAKGAAETAAASAAGSYSGASAAQTAAGQSAQAAQGSAASANTAAGSAQAYSALAATSASDALGSANSAAISSGVSASAQSVAVLAAAAAFPPTFGNRGRFFTRQIHTAAPGTDVEDALFYNDPGSGYVFLASGVYAEIGTKGLRTLEPGHTYQAVTDAIVYSAPYSDVNVGLLVYNVAGAELAFLANASLRITATDGFHTIGSAGYFSTESIRATYPTAVSIRGVALLNAGAGNNAVVGISRLAFNDITATLAAATSASSAAASDTAAGQKSSAANTSATSANTAARQASTSAQQASQSATDASGYSTSAAGFSSSASASSQSAAQKLSDANQAAVQAAASAVAASVAKTGADGSASSASTQANSAYTQALNAYNYAGSALAQANAAYSSAQAASTSAAASSASASAAQSSSTLAANLQGGALNPNPVFGQDWIGGVPPGWDDWSYGGRGTKGPGDVSPNSYDYDYSPATVNNSANVGIAKSFPIPGAGWYVVETTFRHLTGGITGAGLQIASVNANNGGLEFIILTFATDTNNTRRAAIGPNPAAAQHHFAKLIHFTNPAAVRALLYCMTNWDGIGSATAKRIQWSSCFMRLATPGEIETGEARGGLDSISAKIADVANVAASQSAAVATTVSTLRADYNGTASSVTTLQGAMSGVQGRTAAYSQTEANAGAGATAFVSLKAETSPGVVTSDVALGARTLSVYNGDSNAWMLAMRVTGGNATFYGGLSAQTFMRLGNGAGWPVALANRMFGGIYDGALIDWHTYFRVAPDYLFDFTTLAPLGSGESYSLTISNFNGYGGIARLKKRVVGSVTTTSVGPANEAFNGGGAGRQIPYGYGGVATSPRSQDNTYRFIISGSVYVTWSRNLDYVGTVYTATGTLAVDCFFYDGTNGWIKAGTMSWDAETSLAPVSGSKPANAQQTVTLESTQHRDFDTVYFGAATNTALSSYGPFVDTIKVVWSWQGVNSEVSATPNGQTCALSISPRGDT